MKFILRPKPILGECLSGYIQNVASKNFISPGQVCQTFGFNNRIYKQSAISNYLDVDPYQSFDVKRFSDMLNLDINTVEQLTFLPLQKKFDFIDNRYLYKSIRTKRYYCSECLKEDNTYRLIWQIKGIHFCKKHNTKLISHCLNCGNTVSLLGKYGEIGKCTYCGLILTNDSSSQYIASDKEKILLDLWQHLLDFPDNNTYNIDGLCFKNSLAIKLLFLLKDHDSSATKRKLYMYTSKNSNYDGLSINMDFIVKILLQTNTNFTKILTENIPEYFINNILYKNSNNLTNHKNIIKLFI